MTTPHSFTDRPLSGLYVIDLIDGPLASATRYLAELGAHVARFRPPSTAADDIAANAGKIFVSTPLDLDHIRQADIIVAPPSSLDMALMAHAKPSLILMEISPFGQNNSLSEWKASDAVLHALSGGLSRSGIRGRAPLLPPGQLAWQCAASQAAYVMLAAHFKALRCGTGEHIDYSALDGAMQALDPGYGINGSATMGRPAHLLSRDRPAIGTQYPIFDCADGAVRICLLAPRQWQGMFRWMGEPAAFAAPEFAKISTRQQSTELQSSLATFFASRRRADLETQGQAHGVPISAMLSFSEFAASDQIAQRQALTTLTTPSGDQVIVPNGVLTIDGARMGPVNAAAAALPSPHPQSLGDEQVERPFDGLKVLDLGVIVVGAEAGRMFSDGGADVIKIESTAFPDGSRQSYLPYGLSESFAAGHRNKRSLGLDLRHEEGRALFLDLVRHADILLSNFKPGTMDSLGLGPDTLLAINPTLIMADSSAFGPTGPWAKRLGYGPLVRAATGLTMMWRYPDAADSFSDAVTVYPDHVAGRISALGVTALLIRRLRTRHGGTASVSQAEVMLAQFAPMVIDPNIYPSTASRVLPAAGDDDWCVVTAHPSDPALTNLLAGQSLTDWVAQHSAMDAATQLQAAGIAAAPMLRVCDLPNFTYARARGCYRVDHHPHLIGPIYSERATAQHSGTNPPDVRPAPLMGEHSEDVLRDWLHLSEDRITKLKDLKVLQPTQREIFEQIASFTASHKPSPP
ncbi:CaiB/BaiF CoA-transferase family protein [Sphingopyxis yananensis]|uniref:CaiB/BaiF CoA-transferase family protein n=1 Tax=Sphingopyxis yananensis TaxID=2886687 RepID=UPI001D10EE09|nr:CoA transferase [Sphingopyxis yananensis]MCC2601962.1 CoA transferase [Sphingopyxis yananensis]